MALAGITSKIFRTFPPKEVVPFAFSTVNERTMLRFLKLIQCDNGKIGTYVKLVDDRNETAHPNGNIFFSTQEALDRKILEILRVVAEIQEHSREIILNGYRGFLRDSADPEEREYPDPADQVRETLIHGSYFSAKDIEFCADLDIADKLSSHQYFPEIKSLHQSLQAFLPEAEETEAATTG